MKHTKSFAGTKGFTIIEVALVLAIAGLIFLVVFLALPALQNSQKDTAAKEDAGRIVSALQSYSADNQGSLPSAGTAGAGAVFTYAGASNLSQIKTVTAYGSTVVGGGTATLTSNVPGNNSTASIIEGYKCDGTTNAGDAAVQIKLTNGTTYCANM